MLNWLKELLVLGYDHVKFWQVVDQWEVGVMLRFGKVQRSLFPGLYFKIPFAEIAQTNPGITDFTKTFQQLTTKDDVRVGVETTSRFRIVDPELHWRSIYQGKDCVDEIVKIAAAESIENRDYKDILGERGASQVTQRKARAEAKKYGMEVESITFTAFGRMEWYTFSGIPEFLTIMSGTVE